MLKELRQKEYVITGITKQVKSSIKIIKDLLFKNHFLKYRLIFIVCFQIYLYYLYLFDTTTKISKLEKFFNCNSIFDLRYNDVR